MAMMALLPSSLPTLKRRAPRCTVIQTQVKQEGRARQVDKLLFVIARFAQSARDIVVGAVRYASLQAPPAPPRWRKTAGRCWPGLPLLSAAAGATEDVHHPAV